MKKGNLKTLLTVLALAAVATTCVFAGCGKGEDTSAVKVSLDKTEIEITVGETYTLTAEVKNAAENAEIVWTTSDSSVATVNDGTVRAVAAGSATVKAAVGDAFASCEVTVVAKGEVSISLDRSELVMQTGDAPVVLYADVRNEPDDEDVEWRSSDVSVATVLGGRVSAVGAGNATITAEIAGKTDTCELTVLAFDPQIVLAEESLNLFERDTVKVGAEVKSHGRTETGVVYEWTTENAAVATVDAGYVTAVYEGNTTITVRARTDDGRIDVSKPLTVAVSSRTVSFKVNRMIENAEGEWVKDGETEQFTCKEGDEYVFEKIWTYNGLLIDTSKLAEEGLFGGFDFAQDGSSEIDVYYSKAVPVAESDGKAFIAFTPNHSSNPAHIGGTFDIENVETEVGGKTGAIKLTNTDSARQLLRLVGVNKAWAEEKGFERLSFEFYADNVSATNVVFYIGGYSAASAHISQNMSNLETVVYLYDETNTRVYNTVDGKWFRAEIILADTLDATNTAFPAFQIQVACTAGTDFYIRDAKFYTPDYQTYSAEYYFENDGGEFVKDETISFTRKGIVGDEVSLTADVFDGYVFDSGNANNVLTATLDGENDVVLKIYYKIARYSNYSVKYYTQNDDGVSYTEQTAAGYTVENVLEGSAATAEIKTFAGRTLNTSKSALRDEVLPDNGLTLAVYYDVAVPIANTDGTGYFFNFATGSTMQSGIGGYYSYIDAYQGLNGVYKFTQTVRRSWTAVVGIDPAYVAASEYGYLRFDMYSADTAGTANIVLNLNNGKGGLFSMHSASEVASRGKGIYFFDKATGEALNAFVYGKWITVIIDLDGVQGGNSANVPRLYLQMGLEQDKTIYFANMTLANRVNADYTVEYYLENDLGEFVKDDARTATLSGEIGLTVSANPIAITDYTFDEENVNNVKVGTVLADGSLVLKLYYKQEKIRNYDVEYYLRQNDGTYAKSATLSETLSGAVGATVKAEIKDVDGYVYSMRNPSQVLSATLAESGTVLKVYYDNGIAITDDGGNTVAILAGELYGANIADMGTSVELAADKTITNGTEKIYSHVVTESGTLVKLMPLGISRADAVAAGYKKLSMKMYVTSDVSIDRIYQMARYTDAGLKEYRINSGNMTGNAYVRVFNESGERVYEFASDYEGWITIEYLIGSTIDGYGIADTVNDSSVINSGIYIAAYITTAGNSANLNKPVYISEVKLSTADLSDSLA